MKTKIKQMHKLQQDILSIRQECNILGKTIYGDSYEDCYLNDEEVLVIFEDSCHEFESEEYYFNKEGEEL